MPLNECLYWKEHGQGYLGFEITQHLLVGRFLNIAKLSSSVRWWLFSLCKIVMMMKQKILKNVLWMFSKCWLFFQLSALSTVSDCLPFTINTFHLTSLTKGSSKRVRIMRGFFWPFCILETCPSHFCPSPFPLPHSLALYPPTFSDICIYYTYTYSTSTYIFIKYLWS